jgi:hypothetical protein
LLTPKSENDKCAKQLRSSAGVIVFVSGANDRQQWIEVGRCYECFALQATALGIRTAFLNQPGTNPSKSHPFVHNLRRGSILAHGDRI